MFLAQVFQWLDNEKIKYCVERNYQGYPEELTGDLDLVISDRDIKKAANGITNVATSMNWFCYQKHAWEKSIYLGFGKLIFPQRFALTIELFAGARWHGLSYLSAKQILKYRQRSGITWHPRPSHQAAITCIHHLLYNNHVPEKYRSEVHFLTMEDSQSFHSVMSHSFGSKLAVDIFDKIKEKEWDALNNKVPAMKYAVFKRQLFKNPIGTLQTIYLGFKAKRKLPSGVILSLCTQDESLGEEFSSLFLDLADKWHLFVPPIRKIITNKNSGHSPIKVISKVVRNGGVAILNFNNNHEFLSGLSFPIYEICLERKHWELSLKKLDSSSNITLFEDAIEDEATAVAHIWNHILANRALKYNLERNKDSG